MNGAESDDSTGHLKIIHIQHANYFHGNRLQSGRERGGAAYLDHEDRRETGRSQSYIHNVVGAHWYELYGYTNNVFGVVTSGSSKRASDATLKSMIAANPVK